MIERENIDAPTGAQPGSSARGPHPPPTADELQRRRQDDLFEWKRRATIWRERALMAKALCDTLQANVSDLRRLVKALDDERDAREAALASGQEELELESADREAPVEVSARLAQHNGRDSNGHEANGAATEPRPVALAWTAPETASTPPAAAPVDAPDDAVIDLAAIEAEEVAAEAAPTPEPEPAPVEALVAVGAPSLEHEVDVPAAPLASAVAPPPVVSAPPAPPSAPTPVIAHMSAELFGASEGAPEPLPDRGERRQRRGWARMSRKVKRAR